MFWHKNGRSTFYRSIFGQGLAQKWSIFEGLFGPFLALFWGLNLGFWPKSVTTF